MDADKLDKILKDIFIEVFKYKGEINLSTSSEDIKEWDSLRHVMLIAEIEKKLNIRFDLDEILGMQSFGEICSTAEKKIKS